MRQEKAVDSMGVRDEKLWKILQQKAREEDKKLQPDQQIFDEYLSGVKSVCDFGIDRAKTIRDTFPMYTLHDETHICNVLRIMGQLLGNRVGDLTRDEAAMLILSACCHDVGMSYSEREKEALLQDRDRLDEYLERHHNEYVKAYAKDPDKPELTDEILRNYLRSIHHERILELLNTIEWPNCLWGKVDRDDLVRVCQSHGEDSSRLNGLESTSTVDLRFCAVMLRLADILDFDTIRAPKTVYQYCGFEYAEGSEAKISMKEWEKHMASQGFDFVHVADRSVPYDLPYHATSESMKIEQAVNSYLDWVDRELDQCGKLLRKYVGRWKDFNLPGKIKRTIKAEGYVSGQYHLTMDQDKVMELLVGENLYSDPSAFVRELLQNAIDAVRTREQLDKQLPRNWKPQINIRSWMDEKGYHWFRIEDNGTGMTKEIVENYFLKIGRSYYNSDAFEKDKIRYGADPNYTPISRFGIGILSCFMGGKDSNRVEVSTKRFGVGVDGERPSALRLSMHGMNGYYYMASQREGHCPEPMKGVTELEKRPYLQQPGTVIAVRANLYQTGKYTGFKEIVDRYVVYPPVPIHYDGPEGSYDYATQEEFMEVVHSIHPSDDLSQQGVLEFPMTEEQLQELHEKIPVLHFDEPPKIVLKCAPLDQYTKSSYLSGAMICFKLVGNHEEILLRIEETEVKVHVAISMDSKKSGENDSLAIFISFNVENSNEKWETLSTKWEWLNGKYYFTVGHFRDLPWYETYFLNVYKRVNLMNLVAHNGIFSGSCKNFLNAFWSTAELSAIVLLMDQYRPEVDVSRSEIWNLSLETACDFALIQERLLKEGFSTVSNLENVLKERPWMIPLSAFQSLVEKRPDFVERLTVYTVEGAYKWGKLEERMEIEPQKALLLRWGDYRINMFPENPMDLEWQLKLACLKLSYDLRMKMNVNSNKIYIFKKTKDHGKLYDNIFPPSLFIYPETECRYLTRGWKGFRHFCNADHRLSKFMLENVEFLQQRVPGILKEMVRTLQEENGEQLVSGINNLLNRLRSISGQSIQVPADLSITMDDLC